MLEALFSSRVRAKLLTNLFMSPGVEHNAWELTKALDESYSAVWKELVRLESMGILTSKPKNNAKNYSVNPDCPIAPELRSMILKTAGIGDVLRSNLSDTEGIKQVFIYGSYASGEADEQSDLDLMVIGEIELTAFSPIITQLENKLKRPINYTLFTKEEWKAKIANEDAFAINVMRSPKVVLIGGEDGL